MLKLVTAIVLSETAAIINIASVEPVVEGTELKVTGWGVVNEQGRLPTNLQVVDVNLVLRATCIKNYGENTIQPSMICAGVHNGGKDACRGDSGGPLVQMVKGVSRVQVGIVSWGIGCARPNYPGVYSNVAHLNSWIVSKMKL